MKLIRRMTKTVAMLAFASCVTLAQEKTEPKTITFGGIEWTAKARVAETEDFRGRDALKVSGGRLEAEDIVFTDGVISFDVAFNEGRTFVGAGWRQDRPEHGEYWYLRGHLSGNPDSMQYTPVENGLSAWQIFSDGNAQAVGHHDFKGWNKVKIVVIGDQADIYYNSDQPILHVPDLKTDSKAGLIWLYVPGRNGEPAYFSDIKVRGLDGSDKIVGKPKESKPLPDGLITQWQVSQPIKEEAVKGELTLKDDITEGLSFRSLDVETNGIANLAKVADPDDGDTVLIRRTIPSDMATMKKLTFGFSDRARIYLNGKRVFSGNAGWTLQDYRFLGTVGFYQNIGLDLREGENELVIAVSETFGGWAWAGAITD